MFLKVVDLKFFLSAEKTFRFSCCLDFQFLWETFCFNVPLLFFSKTEIILFSFRNFYILRAQLYICSPNYVNSSFVVIYSFQSKPFLAKEQKKSITDFLFRIADDLSRPLVRWHRENSRRKKGWRRKSRWKRRIKEEKILSGKGFETFFPAGLLGSSVSPWGSAAPPVDPRRLLRHSHVDDGGSQTYQSLSISPKLYYIFCTQQSCFLGLMDRSLRGSERRGMGSVDESNNTGNMK